MMDRPGRFLSTTIIAATTGALLTLCGHADGGGVVAFLFGMYMTGEGFGWLIEFLDD